MFTPAMGETVELVTVPLGRGDLRAKIDAADAALVVQHRWRAIKDGLRTYAVTNSRDGWLTMHSLILGKKDGLDIDHRNGDGLDNRRENLRHAPRSVNTYNRQTTGQFRGVKKSTTGPSWEARIGHEGKKVHIGSFPSAEQAARAYDEAAQRLYGADARLNFPLLPAPSRALPTPSSPAVVPASAAPEASP